MVSNQSLATHDSGKLIRLAVVDDEPLQSERIRSMLDRYSRDSNLDISVRCFSDGDEFLDSVAQGVYDILLLDIQMKRIDGLTAANRARAVDSRVVIIFITNIVQYAVQGYSVKALDFLVKPVDYSTLAAKMDAAIDQVNRQGEVVACIRTTSGVQVLDLNEIVCVELLSRKLIIHTPAESHFCNETLHGIEEKLADPRFFRCHAAFLVNLQHVRQVGKSTALVGSLEVPISRYRYKAFLDSLTRYLGKGIW